MTFISASQDPKGETIGTGSTECKEGLKMQLKVGLLRQKTMPKHFLNKSKVRDAWKKKIAHIFSTRDNSQIAAPLLSSKPQKWAIFFRLCILNSRKNRSFFAFWRQILISPPPPHPLSRKDKKWAIFFASILNFEKVQKTTFSTPKIGKNEPPKCQKWFKFDWNFRFLGSCMDLRIWKNTQKWAF